MKTKWLRRSFVLLLCMVLMLGSSTSAFAYYNDEEGNDGVTVEEVTTTPEPSPVGQEPEPAQEPQGQITPDGNLSLMDDLDYSARGGLQFMTVTTRSGHVYYIVIDRTANSQNVYFLNQVDEYDLMSRIRKRRSSRGLRTWFRFSRLMIRSRVRHPRRNRRSNSVLGTI